MIGAFNSQAYNLILLAEDEARMLGQMRVEPEHLLLAFSRRGNVASLLASRDLGARDIYDAIVRRGGLGDELLLGPVPRSHATDAVLERAFDAAALRGVHGPGSEHVLLALAQDTQARALLEEVGVADVEEVVDRRYPPTRDPLSAEQVKSFLLKIGDQARAPQPGPIPPVFERFTSQAQHAIRAATECAALLENHYVEPFHLLLGLLRVPDGVVATVLGDLLQPSDMGMVGEAMERARMCGPHPAHQATGIFTEPAREIVAQQALKQAYRHHHALIGTGHLLLATLDSPDPVVQQIIGEGPMGAGRASDRLARRVLEVLPGDEQPSTRAYHGMIKLDVLINEMTRRFDGTLPAGWTVTGSGRSDGIRLKVPNTKSEEDFRIDLGWIIDIDQPATQRLLRVTEATLHDVQAAVVKHQAKPWPTSPEYENEELPKAHTEIIGDDVNPMLRLYYGDPETPTLELLPRPLLLTRVIEHSL